MDWDETRVQHTGEKIALPPENLSPIPPLLCLRVSRGKYWTDPKIIEQLPAV